MHSTNMRLGPCVGRRLAALAAVVLAGAAQAQIYGWTDANGDVTYSNLPPPKGAKVTDVIHETPLSPQAIDEAAKRSEISALNDRIRLLELEAARSKREVVDYPGNPPQSSVPAGGDCGSSGYSDCNSQWGPYYTTGFLYGNGDRHRHDHDHDHDRDHGRDNGHPKGPSVQPVRLTPPPSPSATHIAASPNKSSIAEH